MAGLTSPTILTFDVFGTLVDWREGMRRDLAACHIPLEESRWENVLADQEQAERRTFETYTEITTWSLVRRLGLPRSQAAAIAENLGDWPLFSDSAAALQQLLTRTRCVAMTNSDRRHGERMQKQIGFPLTAWICAEETRVYKPNPAFWQTVADRLHLTFGKRWWHVSAYADYDLATAASLGLTTVLVKRPHCRAGVADLEVPDLAALVLKAT